MIERRSSTKVIMLLGALLVLASGRLAYGAPFTIDFENLPSLPAQPNNFLAAGPMQTFGDAGVFSISGGVVLGNPTDLASFPAHGSAPNAYGTADFADPSLLPTITLTFPSAEDIVSVAGVLFNGQPIPETYQFTAFSGASPVEQVTISNVAESFSTSGFTNFVLAPLLLPITSVTITTPDADINGFDFLVDTITVTPGTTNTVPEPSTALIFLSGVIGLWMVRRRMV